MQEHSDSLNEQRHLSDYFKIVWERRGLVLILFLLTLGAGILFTALQTPVYEATAKVEIQVTPQQTLGGRFEEGTQPLRSPWFKESFFQTEFEKIRSRDLLNLVVERKLANVSPFDEAEEPAEILQGSLKLEMVPTTDVAAIRARTADPELAAVIANAVAETYVDWNIEKRIDALSRAHLNLQAKIQEEVGVLEKQQAQELGEVEKQGGYTSGLMEGALRQQIEDAQRRLFDTRATAKRTRQALQLLEASPTDATVTIPDIATDPILQKLQENRATLARELAALLVTRKEGHPAVQEKRQELAEASRDLRARLAGILTNLEAEQRDLQATLASAKRLAVTEQGKADAVRIQQLDTETQREFLEKLGERFRELAILPSVLENQAHLIERATPPENPILPKPLMNILVALVLGMLVSLGSAFFLDYWDTSVRKVEDVEQRLGETVLCAIPTRKPKLEPLVQEAFQSLRTSLLFASKTGAAKSVVFTSAIPQEGKSTIVADLGRALASGGDRTIVLDCDFRKPAQSHIFQVPRDKGISSYLLDEGSDYRAHMRAGVAPGLDLLPTGPLPPNPLDILASQQLADLFHKLEEDYDWVLVDAPPVASMGDATVLADVLHAAVFVVRCDHVDVKTARRALQSLRAVEPRLIGVVLNDVNPRTPGYKDYFYGRYYYEQQKDSDQEEKGLKAASSAGA